MPQRTGHGTRRPSYIRTSTDAVPPASALPTTVFGTGHTRRHTGYSSYHSCPEPSLNDWWGQVIQAPHDLQALVNGIRHGTAVCVTDGSFKAPFGTAAYTVLAHLGSNDPFLLVNKTPGKHTDIDSYCCELGGIYGCLALVEKLTQSFGITHGSNTLACDCITALQNVFTKKPIWPSKPHFDLLSTA